MADIITEYPHFFTATNLEWKKLLIHDKYKNIVIESLRFLVNDKRVIVYGFVIMDNHIHVIWQLQAGRKRDDVQRGFVLAAVNTIKAFDTFKAKIYALTKKEGGRHKPFVSNYTPQFFFRTANVTGSIILPDDISVVMPGDSLVVNIKLVNKIPLNLGLRFIMREGNITIGAGIILEFV